MSQGSGSRGGSSTAGRKSARVCDGCGLRVPHGAEELAPVRVLGRHDPRIRRTLLLCRECRSNPSRSWRLRWAEVEG